MPSIAHLDTTALDTAAKFFRTMQRVGADFTGPVQNVTKRQNLAAYLALGCPKVDGNGVIDTTPTPESLARLLLGKDFITPQEVTAVRGLSYTDEQIEGLEVSFPSIEVIAWCCGNGYALIPAPPTAMSLLDVRKLDIAFFDTKRGWYAGERETFARVDKTEEVRWLAVRKEAIPVSFRKNWSEQQALLLSGLELVPNAAEMSWFITTYFAVRGVRLFSDVYVRTSSLGSGGDRVSVGYFGAGGLSVGSWDDDARDGDVGLSAARKF